MSSKVDKITAVTEGFDGYEKQRVASELTEEAQTLGMYDGDTIEELRATCAALRAQVEELRKYQMLASLYGGTIARMNSKVGSLSIAILDTIYDLDTVGIHRQPFLQKIKERLERAIRPQDESSQSP